MDDLKKAVLSESSLYVPETKTQRKRMKRYFRNKALEQAENQYKAYIEAQNIRGK